MSTADAGVSPGSEIIPSADSPYWRGAYTWLRGGCLWRPWRLAPERARRAHAPELIERAQMAAGVRAECTTDADALSVQVNVEETSGKPSMLDVTVDGVLGQRIHLTDGGHTINYRLPSGCHKVRVWLPQAGLSAVGPLKLHDATQTAPLRRRPKWVTYGSSISQCTAAAGPSLTWPALVATQLDWDLTCLGFGGQCQLDPIVERTFESLEADVISLCLGINSYGANAFSERTFAAQASGFIERIRDAHPRVPILVISPIASPERERLVNAVGLTLTQVRAMVSEVVEVLAESDSQLHLIDGLSVLEASEAHLLEDGLHPTTEGYRVMADRLAGPLGRFEL